ncbi:MAG: hypothetical protein Q9167_000665 [Letrouitia subvulpina]
MFESRKRAREEDDSDCEPQGQDHKKPRTLPFRAFPTTKHLNLFSQSARFAPKPLLTPALTPVETSEDEDEPRHGLRTPPREKSAQLTLNSVIVIDEPMDSDVDMDLSPLPRRLTEESIPASPRTMVPCKKISHKSQDAQLGGRIPTPIYGHFNKSVDTNMEMVDDAPSQQELEYDLLLRRRRLPSPISEDEAMRSPSEMGGMLDQLDMGTSKLQIPFRTNRMWGSPVTSTKGKMTLSMGYRADCEKCRMKVPGHYNHFIRS